MIDSLLKAGCRRGANIGEMGVAVGPQWCHPGWQEFVDLGPGPQMLSIRSGEPLEGPGHQHIAASVEKPKVVADAASIRASRRCSVATMSLPIVARITLCV